MVKLLGWNGRRKAVVKWLATASLLAASTSALAQQPGPAVAEEEQEEIVVTGSRVSRGGFDTPTPVTSVSAEEFETRGTSSIADYLNIVPSFSPTSTPSTTTLSSGKGSNFADLRGLRPARTLVLINGRRHVPTNASGQINLNIVPLAVTDRVEVVTGGASAAYGSDAVAGVVNVIYADRLEGLRATAQAGLAKEGDAADYLLSAAWGTPFARGRGHFVVAAEYNENDGIKNQQQRDWSAKRWQRIANPLDTGPGDGQPAVITRSNVIFSNNSENGFIRSPGPLTGIEFLPGGGFRRFPAGTLLSPPFQVGGEGINFGEDTPLATPIDRKALLASARYEFSDAVTAYAEGSLNQIHGRSNTVQPFSFGNTVIERDNAFLPMGIRTLMDANGIGSFRLARIHTDFGFIVGDNKARTYQLTGGLKGRFPQGWSWDVYASHGETNADIRQFGNLIQANYNAAVDAVSDSATGNVVCRSRTPGCVPLNLFGFGSPSAAAIDYVTGDQLFEERFRQTVIAADLEGRLFDLGAGPIGFAVGAEYRKQDYDLSVDELSASDAFLISNRQPYDGRIEVKEAFGEIVVPLLRSRPFFHSLELNAAVRLTDYSTSGSVTTWKAGATWEAARSIRLRGTYSRDIRAPNVPELFSPISSTAFFFAPFDPCNAAQQAGNTQISTACRQAGLPADFAAANTLIPVASGGNPALSVERATTKTAGVVFKPGFLRGFRASVDWFDIRIKDAIASLDTQRILDRCYESGTLDNPACALVSRGTDGQLTTIRNTVLNIASERVAGVDWEFLYRLGLRNDDDLTLRMVGTRLYRSVEALDGVTRINRLGRVGVADDYDVPSYPKWRWTANAVYDRGGFTGGVVVRYIGKGKIDPQFGPEDLDDNSVTARWYFDLSLAQDVKARGGTFAVFGGVRNLFDRDPPIAPGTFLNTLATNVGLYDVVGRFFYAGVRSRF